MVFMVEQTNVMFNKTPFGAVKTDEKVSVFVSIEGFDGSSSLLIIKNELDKSRVYIEGCKEDSGFRFEFSLPCEGGYSLHMECDDIYVGNNSYSSVEAEIVKWELTVYDRLFKTPEKFYGGIMYQIFPDRFCKSSKYTVRDTCNNRKFKEDWNSLPDSPHDFPNYSANDFFGGNIDGIIERLPYLKELCVDIIYLNPIFESAENHRYSTANYLNVDPVFGTNEQFERLAMECDALGMKLILDGVFSHTGADSIYFNKFNHYDSVGAYNSELSPYYPWYVFNDYPNDYRAWWGFKNLPDVEETNLEYLNYIMNAEDGVLNFWQRKGASGWRLDVVDELPDVFLDKLRESVKREDEEALIIGEVWENAAKKESYGERRQFLFGNQMDSVMNYPWRDAIISYVKEGNAEALWNSVLDILESYPYPAIQCLMNLLSSHDTIRIITELSGVQDIPATEQGTYILTRDEYLKGCALLMPATFLQFTLPGIPSIYYGDEIGMQGFRDPFSRMPFAYGKEDMNILEFFKKITKARSDRKEDFSSDFRLDIARDGLFAFWRGNSYCVVNTAEKIESIKKEGLKEVFNHNILFAENELTIYPMSFGIFSR